MTFFECIFLVALIAAFIVTLAKKWGAVEYLQVHGNDFFSKMANCDFCLSWWVSLALGIVFFIVTGNGYFLVAPFCSTMISRFIL